VSPNLARAPEIHQIRANFLQTLLFKGISTPLSLVLVVLQSRYLHTSGRGSFVLVVLSVSILARLLGQLGYAVASRMQAPGRELHELVHRAFAIGAVLGGLGTGAIIGWGMLTPGVGLSIAVIAACALVPTIIWQCICGVLLGVGRVRLWNVIQTLPPVLTGVGMLLIVAALHGGVRGAVLAWTLAHVLTALYALATTRDVWQPLPINRLLDFFNLPLARLALTMGAVQVVNLISYRIELFVLDRSRGIAHVGVYSIAVQTGEMLWLIAGAIATAVTAPCLHDEDEQAASLITRSAVKALACTALVAARARVRGRHAATQAVAPGHRRLRARDDPHRLPLGAAREAASEPRGVDPGHDRHAGRGADPHPTPRRIGRGPCEHDRVHRCRRPRVGVPETARAHGSCRPGNDRLSSSQVPTISAISAAKGLELSPVSNRVSIVIQMT
jgi:hypothetical protein